MATRTRFSSETLLSFADEEERSESEIEVGDLLIALDTCNRSQYALIGNTIRELLILSSVHGEDSVSVIKTALLIAFKRRNHNKSQAEGEGAGEILIFLHTILSVMDLSEEMIDIVESVISLIPVYGSWKDLRVIGELIIVRQLNEASAINSSESTSTGSDALSDAMSNIALTVPSIALHRVCKVICKLFAEQLLLDQQNISSTPSNACKYVPHYSRHFNKKTAAATKRKAEEMASEEDSEVERRESRVRDRSGRGRGGRGGRGGRSGRGGRAIAWTEPDTIVAESTAATSTLSFSDGKGTIQSAANIANCLMADEICRLTCPSEFARKRGKAAFRKLRAGLNSRLVEKGHLIEPLMCKKELQKINFNRASKGALTKYTAAIKKGGQSARWMAAMKRSSNAVPDIDSLARAVHEFAEEEMQTGDDVFKMFSMRVDKAVSSIRASRQKLIDKATELQSARMQTDTSAVEVPIVGVVVDTAFCDDRETRMSLVLAAYLMTKAQGLNHFVVDGVLHALSASTEDAEGVTTELSWDSFVPTESADVGNSVRRFQSGTSALSSALHAASSNSAAGFDVVFVCFDFAAYSEDKDAIHQHITTLQSQATIPLRTIRVHRMRAALSGDDEDFEGSVQYQPRRGLRSLPTDASQITADLAFVVDFTGSMGSFMSAVKRELVRVINAIQSSVRCKGIRVALVGYRDYNDEGRVVKVDFHDRADLDHLLSTIANQQASGGGDSPEDLLSGLVAVNTLSWSSDIRLQVIVTDANAHGFHSYVEGDYHPSGKCPDQTGADYPSLPQIMNTLAEDRQIDTFFCLLNSETLKTLDAVASAYTDDRRGFGTVSIQRGAENFKDKIIACISSAIATTISEIKVSGLQTADGITLSSLMSSLNASLRESLLTLGVSNADESDNEDDEVKEEVTAETGTEEDEVLDLFDDVPEVPEVDVVESTATTTETQSVATSSKKSKTRKAQTDYERLLRELEISELLPVRIALHLPVWTNATLSLKSSAALFNAGVTKAQLIAGNYPESIVNSFTEYLDQALSKV